MKRFFEGVRQEDKIWDNEHKCFRKVRQVKHGHFWVAGLFREPVQIAQPEKPGEPQKYFWVPPESKVQERQKQAFKKEGWIKMLKSPQLKGIVYTSFKIYGSKEEAQKDEECDEDNGILLDIIPIKWTDYI